MALEESLVLARDQLAAGDPAFYGALRTGWRECRCNELAALLERAGSLTPWADSTKTPKAWQAAWIATARAGEPLALEGLMASLATRVESRTAALVGSCVAELVPYADDPQLTRPLIALLEFRVRAPIWAKVHTRIYQLLETGLDPRAIAALEHTITRAKTEESGSLAIDDSLARAARTQGRLTARFPAGVPAMPAAIAALVAELAKALAGSPTIGAARPRAIDPAQALLEAVWDDPDDDARRLVCADALQAAGDPRGELIAAQLSDAPDAARRAKTLIAKHRHALLGPLAKSVVASTAVFEKGFLAECEAGVVRRVEVDAVFGRPEWATVKKLRVIRYGALTPQMRALVEVQGLPEAGLACLARTAFPRLEVIGVLSTGAVNDGLRAGKPTSPGLRALAAATGLPKLRELHLALHGSEYRRSTHHRTADDYAWIFAAPFGHQLEVLHVRFADPSVLGSWLALLVRSRLRQIAARLDEIEVVLDKHGEKLSAVLKLPSEERARAALSGRIAMIRAALGNVSIAEG